MNKLFSAAIALICASLFSGCTVNNVRPLPGGAAPSAQRAVLVYGVQLEGSWAYQGFPLQLVEYDLANQNISGNCFRFNRTEASVPPVAGTVRYFAFDVPAGYYVLSPFQTVRLSGDTQAFEVPAGSSVYAGDFILGKDQTLRLQRDTAPTTSITTALPDLKQPLQLAKTVVVKPPSAFLCTP